MVRNQSQLGLKEKVRSRVVDRREIRCRTWKRTSYVYSREQTASRENRVRTPGPEVVRVDEMCSTLGCFFS